MLKYDCINEYVAASLYRRVIKIQDYFFEFEDGQYFDLHHYIENDFYDNQPAQFSKIFNASIANDLEELRKNY